MGGSLGLQRESPVLSEPLRPMYSGNDRTDGSGVMSDEIEEVPTPQAVRSVGCPTAPGMEADFG